MHVASAPTDMTTLTMGGPRAPPSGASACPNPRSPECRVALGRLSRFPPCSPCPSSGSATSPKVRTRVRTHSVGQQTPKAHLAERKLPRIGVASRPLRPTATPYALRAHLPAAQSRVKQIKLRRLRCVSGTSSPRFHEKKGVQIASSAMRNEASCRVGESEGVH